jgi:hypothetical protein
MFGCAKHWVCFPIPFTISMDNSDYPEETIIEAVEYWNDFVGFELFDIDGPGQIHIRQSINIQCGDLQDVAGCTEWNVVRGKVRECNINVRRRTGFIAVSVLIHELGHCLSFPHSDDSIMDADGNIVNEQPLQEHYDHIHMCRDER